MGATLFYIFNTYAKTDLLETLFEWTLDFEHLRFHKIIFCLTLLFFGVALDFALNARAERKINQLRLERLQAMRSTMATVHDVVNNALNNLLLIQIEAERENALSPETLMLFKNIISGTAQEIRSIEALEEFRERDLTGGLVTLQPVEAPARPAESAARS